MAYLSGSDSGLLARLQSKCWSVWCSYLKVWLGLKDLLLGWLALTAGELVLAVGKKPRFPFCGPPRSLPACPPHTMPGFSRSKRSEKEIKEEVTLPFMFSHQKVHVVTSVTFYLLELSC